MALYIVYCLVVTTSAVECLDGLVSKIGFTVKSRIQYAHLYNTHPKLSQENRGKTLV